MSRVNAVVLDLIAITVFAVLARIAHQSEDMPLTFLGILSTLWPFVIGVALGWIVVSAAGRSAVRVRSGGWLVWLVTVIVGLAIWGIRNTSFPHWSFILVASLMSALLMLGWRGIHALVVKRGRSGARVA